MFGQVWAGGVARMPAVREQVMEAGRAGRVRTLQEDHAAVRFGYPSGSYHAGLRDAVLRMKRPSHDALSLAMGRLLAERRGSIWPRSGRT